MGDLRDGCFVIPSAFGLYNQPVHGVGQHVVEPGNLTSAPPVEMEPGNVQSYDDLVAFLHRYAIAQYHEYERLRGNAQHRTGGMVQATHLTPGTITQTILGPFPNYEETARLAGGEPDSIARARRGSRPHGGQQPTQAAGAQVTPGGGAQTAQPAQEARHAGPAPADRPHRKVGRNDPCPCGSGRKAKKCCGA